MENGTRTASHLREGVAEEVRALLARKRLSGAKLAQGIDRSEMYVSRRLRGETSFDLDDLERIAGVLGVDVADLLPASLITARREALPTTVGNGRERAVGQKSCSGTKTDRPKDNRSAGHAKRRAPITPSVERAATRRPQRIGSVTHPMSRRDG